MKYRLQFTYMFAPLVFAHPSDIVDLRMLLLTQGSHFEFRGLKALQRRNQWAIELPLGVFANDYRPGAVTLEAELKARQQVLNSMEHKNFHQQRDFFQRDDVWYYRKPFLREVRHYMEKPAMLEAAFRFIEAAEADRSIIKGPPTPRRPQLTVEQRLSRFGELVRGPAWVDGEDLILRQWFSRRTIGPHAGHHAKLTEEEWGFVLAALDHKRTRIAVLRRLNYLNKQLLKRFERERKIVDGYISSAALPEYRQCVLGMYPRMPPQRPRIGKHSRRKDAPSDQCPDATTP